MRLIDADELKKEFPHDEDWDFPVNTNGYVVETINRMPTVDAIPIKWLENYRKKKKRIYGGVDIYSGLQDVINDWRKENE